MASKDVQILSSLVRHIKKDGLDPLTPMVDRYLIERKKSRRRLLAYTIPIVERPRPGGRLSPSSMGGCQRQAVFKFLGVDAVSRIEPDTELIFEDGNWRHHKWQAMFADMTKVLGKDRFKLCSIEKQVAIPELYVSGSYDAVIRINGKLYVVDFKGIRDVGFQHVYRTHAPKEEHVKQLMTYCVAKGIRRGMLLYDNKGNQSFKVFVIEWDKEIWGEVERWCQRVLFHLEEKKLPGRHSSCNRGTFLWERCPYSPICFGKMKDDKEAMRRLAFKGFKGIDEAWEEGNRAVA